jgi:tetratricopeptide (TPR) repeat protein
MAALSFIQKYALMLGLIFVVMACSSTASKKKLNQSKIYFGAGTQSLMSQDYTDALANLMKANELDPENPGIITNLAMAYYFKGERNMAIKLLKKSIDLKEDNSDAKLNLASIYFHDGDLKSAEKFYKLVLKDLTYDKQARTLYNLGILENRKNNQVAAMNYFKKSIKEDSSYCPSYYQIGLIKYQQKQYSASLSNFRDAAMGTCMESAGAHYYQGLSLLGLKRYMEAQMKFDEIDARFKTSEFAAKARKKMTELVEIQKNDITEEVHASRKVLESPDF